MKTPLHISDSSFAAIIAITLMIPAGQLTARDDGETATTATPPGATPLSPTVPGVGTGGPQAVALSPGTPQAKPALDPGQVPPPELSVAEIVAGAEDFTTLMGALRAAGLSDSLKAAGPFTLLAPDNAAFAALPEGLLKTLMMPQNLDALAKILSFHIIPQKLTKTQLLPGSFTTHDREALTVFGGAEGDITIQGARLGRTDVMATNGVVHVIKRVLIPPSVKPVVDSLTVKTPE